MGCRLWGAIVLTYGKIACQPHCPFSHPGTHRSKGQKERTGNRVILYDQQRNRELPVQEAEIHPVQKAWVGRKT